MNINLDRKISTKIFGQIVGDTRLEYTDLIESISHENRDSIYWWCSMVASRNPYSGQLFWDICKINYLKKLCDYYVSKNKLDLHVRINVAYKEMADLVSKILCEKKIAAKVTICNKGYAQISIKGGDPKQCQLFYFKPNKLSDISSANNSHHIFIKSYCEYIWDSLKLVKQFNGIKKKNRKIGKRYRPKGKNCIQESEVLVDIFLRKDSLDSSGKFSDTYYGNMVENIQKNGFKISYLPFIYDPVEFEEIMVGVIKNGNDCVLIQDYLKYTDYFKALFLPYFIRKKIKFKNVELSYIDLVKYYLAKESFYSIGVIAYLQYLFVKRVSKKLSNLKTYINWFENQVQDHAINFAFRKYMPNVKTVGMQQFHSPIEYLSNFPTNAEYRSESIPELVLVSGKCLVPIRQEFSDLADIRVAPAFRFEYIHNAKNVKTYRNGSSVVLIAWPMFHFDEQFMDILQIIDQKYQNLPGLKILIKLHPTASSGLKFKLADLYSKNSVFELTERNFKDLIGEIDLVIVSLSNLVMEALALGIPVITIANRNSYPSNSIYSFVDKKLYRKCVSAAGVFQAIEFFSKTNPDYRNMTEDLRTFAFEKVTEKSIDQFIRDIIQ